MRKYYLLIFLMFMELAGIWLYKNAITADTPLQQNLLITQTKISGDEFIVLRNNTALDIQLSNYWLQYFNEASLTAVGVSNSSAQLPDAKLPAGREVILSTGVAPLCGQVLAAKLPFALKDSAGLLQVVAISQTGAVIGYAPQDQVSWSNAKTGNSADLKLPSSQDARQVWFRANAQSGWQSGIVDYNSACQSGSGGGGQAGTPVSATLADSTGTPPYVILGVGTSSDDSAPRIPAGNNGLAPPQISELLPNPAPPQTDANDEFVELYNPNDKPFELSGFILRVGTSSIKEHKFAEGTLIEPKAFKTFLPDQTKLALSNSEGQAKLLDPAGKELTISDPYESAKDGQAWILASDKWQWTTKPTPGAANALAAAATKSSKKPSSKTSASVNKSGGHNVPGGNPSESSSGKTIHPAILAGVGAAALLYAGYEYRHDLQNAFYRLRRHRTVSGSSGTFIESPRSH